MKKAKFNPTPALFPVPTVLVSSQNGTERNLITIAWTGIMNSQPPMVYIGVNPIRYSHHLIKESGEYVINIPSVTQAELVDYCGMVSGKTLDKFKETGLTPIPGDFVRAPLVEECPVNIECKVTQMVSLPSHDVFIAEILAVHYNEDVLNERGKPDLSKVQAYAFCGNEYLDLGGKVGFYGYSRKK